MKFHESCTHFQGVKNKFTEVWSCLHDFPQKCKNIQHEFYSHSNDFYPCSCLKPDASSASVGRGCWKCICTRLWTYWRPRHRGRRRRPWPQKLYLQEFPPAGVQLAPTSSASINSRRRHRPLSCRHVRPSRGKTHTELAAIISSGV